MRPMEPIRRIALRIFTADVTIPSSYIPADKDTEFLQREELRSIRIGLELLEARVDPA